MELIRGLHNLKKQSCCVVTIGNFDGVHIGHQEILKNLVNTAIKQALPSLVISFSVTPETFFGRPKARISNFRDKHMLLESLGVDKHLLIRFDNSFSEELHRVMVHGILHLIGYDDKTEKEKNLMREKENFYLKKLCI